MQSADPGPRSQISTHFAAAQLCACTPGRCSTKFLLCTSELCTRLQGYSQEKLGHFCLANSLLLHKHLLVVSAHHVSVQPFFGALGSAALRITPLRHPPTSQSHLQHTASRFLRLGSPLDRLEHEVGFFWPLNCAIGTRRCAQMKRAGSAARFARQNLNPAQSS